MRFKSLKINAFLNCIKTVISIVFPFITYPYLLRVLSVNTIGVYNFSHSIISYFILIAGLGISTYAVREGTKLRKDKQIITDFVSDMFSISLLSTAVSYVLLFVSLLIIPKLSNYRVPIIILSVQIIFISIGVSWLANIFEDFLFSTIQTVIVHIFSLVLIFCLVKTKDDLYNYLWIIVFSQVLSSIINLLYYRIKYCKFRISFSSRLKQHFKPIIIIFSTTVAITIYVSSDVTMLGLMTSDYDVGLYSTAVKIYTIVKSVLSSVFIVLIPRFSVLLQSKDDVAKTDELFAKVFNTLVLLVAPVSVGLFITSSDVVNLIGGEEYLGGSTALQLLSVAIMFSLIAFMFTQCVLIPQKKEKTVFYITIISAITNVALNLIFIPLFGINGAAITTIIAEAIVCILSAYHARHFLKPNKTWLNFLSIILGCLVIVLIGMICNHFIKVLIYRFSVTVIMSVFSYFAILLLCRNKFFISILNKAN